MDVLDPKTIGSVIAAIAGIVAAWITGRNLRENTRLSNWLQAEREKADEEHAERIARIGAEEDRQGRLDKQTWELLEQYRREVASLRTEMDQMRSDHKAELAAIRKEYDQLISENGALRARVAELEYQLKLRPAPESA